MEVTLESIGHHYGSTEIFKDLGLTIDSGVFFSLLGPSGCGKTTLLRMLAGFVVPDVGRVLFAGQDVTRLPVHRREVGMVFHDYALFPDRSVLANVMFGLEARRVAGSQARAQAMAMLERVGLTQYAMQRPAALSGGQRQRVAMARALVIRPRLLLLDEPLSALDAGLRVELRTLIRQLQREYGITTVFVTHDQQEALAISDQVAVMSQGQIVQVGTPLSVYQQPNSAFAASFVGDANLLEIRSERLSTDGSRRFETDAGTVLSNAVAPLPTRAFLAIRGECIDLFAPVKATIEGSATEPATAAQRDLSGVIEAIEFRGATVVYSVRVEGALFQIQRWSAAHASGFAKGQDVTVRLPIDASIVAA